MAAEAPRLDKWLWFARLAKSRSVAQQLCAGGHVRLNGQKVDRGHRAVRLGDVIEVVLGPVRRTVTVAAFGARRGPAAEARTLYLEPDPPVRLAPADDLPVAARLRGAGRPSKRDRRRIDAFTGRPG